MATGTYAPWPALTIFDNSGNIVAGAKVFWYLAGTTTKTNTYSDIGLTTPNANPVIADAAGRITVFLDPGVSYKEVAAPANDTDPPTNAFWTRDNISPVPPYTSDVDITGTAGENLAAGDCVYMSTGAGNDAARTAGRWYKADQTYSNRSALAVALGFATAAITSGSAGTIRIGGQVTGLAGLSAGSNYQIDTTPGAIVVGTQDTAERIIGRADSTTTLVMNFSATVYNYADTHTDGTQVSGIISTGAQVWAGIKQANDGFVDAENTAFLAADATNDTATPANLTGLSTSVVSGRKYAFQMVLHLANSTAADGLLIDFDGGAATMTNFRASAILTRETGAVVTLANAVSAALATDINVAALASTSQHCLVVWGAIEPSSSDTFIPRIAMNADTGGTLTIYRGSFIKRWDIL